MNVKKLQSLILTVLFLGTIFILFVLHVITPDKEQSVLENRTLAKRPDFTFERYISGEYSERFDTYYSDQFPLRDRIVEVNAGINHNVFNQDVFNDVFLAEDG
jgi:DHHW protein